MWYTPPSVAGKCFIYFMLMTATHLVTIYTNFTFKFSKYTIERKNPTLELQKGSKHFIGTIYLPFYGMSCFSPDSVHTQVNEHSNGTCYMLEPGRKGW